MSDEVAEAAHCHGADRLCTCPCIQENGLRISPAREERGRICRDCDFMEMVEKDERERDACVCSWNEFSGRSVCGLPCPVHSKAS